MSGATSKSAAFQGVAKILRFNWPWYAAGVVAIAGILTILNSGLLPRLIRPLAWAGLLLGGFWLLSSVVVSHLVYDRSGLSEGTWLEGLDLRAIDRVAAFHAGQDEASEVLNVRFPTAHRSTFDVFDPKKEATDSLRRARRAALQERPSTLADPAALPLADGELDLGCLVFAAHEIRDPKDRVILFLELHRALNPSGRLIVVEHLRNGWNAMAFGPNVFHFLPRAAWTTTFADSGFRVLREARCTPFVQVFHLERMP